MKNDPSPLSVAIVGAGLRGHFLANLLAADPERFRLAAVHDQSPARSRYFVERLNGGPRIHARLEDLAADPAIEAVIVATPDALHAEPAVAALDAGKHVYLEKPISTTLDDADRIIEASKRSSATLYMGFNLRCSPFYARARKIIRSGAIGRVHTIQATEYYQGGRSMFRRWNRLRRFGGGLWVTKAIHDFDILHYLLGEPPRRVCGSANLFHYRPDPRRGMYCGQCDMAGECPDYWDFTKDPKTFGIYTAGAEVNPQPPDLCLYNSDKDTFDHGVAMLEWDNGALATYTLSIISPVTTRSLVVMGDRAMLQGDFETGRLETIERFSGRRTSEYVAASAGDPHGGGDRRILEDFHACLRNGAPAIADCNDGRRSLRVALAVQQSCDQAGAWIEINGSAR